MFNLPIRTWVCNAAAVFSGPQGAVTQQAQQAGWSRETVSEEAREVEQRRDDPPAALAESRAENQRINQVIATLASQTEDRIRFDKAKQRGLATTAFDGREPATDRGTPGPPPGRVRCEAARSFDGGSLDRGASRA